MPNGSLGGNNTVFQDVTGNTLIRTPDFTLNLGGAYNRSLAGGTLKMSGNLNYQSKQYWEVSNRIVAPARTLLNGEVSWLDPSERYQFTVWGLNLLDETYHLSFLTSGSADAIMYARPRTYGVRLSLYWN